MFELESAETYKLAIRTLSQERLSNYKIFFDIKHEEELYRIYNWNNKIAMLMFRTLNLLEIALRNKFHVALSKRFGGNTNRISSNANWYDNLKMGEKSTNDIHNLKFDKTKKNKVLRSPPPKPNEIVAKLTFGFWHHLLDVKFDQSNKRIDWAEILVDIFPGHRNNNIEYWSKIASQDQLYARIAFCNGIRNRVAHHEPIWKFGPLYEEARKKKDKRYLDLIEHTPTTPTEVINRISLTYNRILELLGWLCPNLRSLHEKSSTHVDFLSTNTLASLAEIRTTTSPLEIRLENYRSLTRLKKKLKYKRPDGSPIFIKSNGKILGRLTAPPD